MRQFMSAVMVFVFGRPANKEAQHPHLGTHWPLHRFCQPTSWLAAMVIKFRCDFFCPPRLFIPWHSLDLGNLAQRLYRKPGY